MVTINIEKRHLFVFSAVIGILIGVLVVAAFNDPPTWTTPAKTFGHSIDEVDWSNPISGPSLPSFMGTNKGVLSVSTPYIPGVIESIDFIYSITGNPVARIATQLTGTGSSLMLGTSNNYASGITNTMVIDPTGNVGIGVSPPQAKLDVNGDIKTTTGMKGAAWVGYKWVADGTQITCNSAGGWYGHYARVNDGKIEVRSNRRGWSEDSGWINKASASVLYNGNYIRTRIEGSGITGVYGDWDCSPLCPSCTAEWP